MAQNLGGEPDFPGSPPEDYFPPRPCLYQSHQLDADVDGLDAAPELAGEGTRTQTHHG